MLTFRQFKEAYNPNEPRVPKGKREGGRWTAEHFQTSTFYHGSSSELESGKMYSGSSSVLWISPEREFAEGYGLHRYKVKMRKGLKNADLTYTSDLVKAIGKKYGDKIKEKLLLGQIWQNKGIEKEITRKLFETYDTITLFDSQYGDSEDDFYSSVIVKNPQENVFIEDSA